MSNNSSGIVSKVWAFCNTLRDDGVGYGDYLEQLTYLLFLKMADDTVSRRITGKCLFLQNTIGNRSQIKAVMNWKCIIIIC